MWHTLSIEETLKRLTTNLTTGLGQEDAQARLQTYGPNALQETKAPGFFAILIGQFKNILTLILCAAGIISFSLGHTMEGITIGIIVVLTAAMGCIQEYRAEKALEALRRLASPTCTVVRDGKEQEIPSRNVVPGDIVLLTTGNRVSADMRLTESINLKADEAMLTGESLPAEKHTLTLDNPKLPLGDRRNMAYAGTAITYGRGRGLVIATGMQSEMGAIAGMVQGVETLKTPLQQNLDRVGKALGKAALALIVLMVALGILRGQSFLDLFLFAIALAVAVVPEALPAVVTISLALGVKRMVARHALVRKLPAVETLGCTSVICSDKTGTLTRDEMTVRSIWLNNQTFEVTGAGYAPEGSFLKDKNIIPPSEALIALLRAAALCTDARVMHQENVWDITGDPTEGALVVVAAKADLQKDVLEAQYPRKAEIPFSAETKYMTTLHVFPDKETYAITKGAPEVIVPFTTSNHNEVLHHAHAMASRGLRVLAITIKKTSALSHAHTGATLLGLVGMADPPRSEVFDAIATCRHAGIRPVMITGDHPETAAAIARELGILHHKDEELVTGAQLNEMNEQAFMQRVETIAVYARVSPADKLRIVQALQAKGHVVAMTGDGVNDAPALKRADIGIAMGITGTDVSKEAAVMTLTDDNFASIVAAIHEGRAIFANIKKYLMYLLSSNIGELGVMLGASVLGLPLPLSAVQLLYVNLATDGLPALALALDPAEGNLMRHNPRKPRTSIFTRPVLTLMLVGGIYSMMINLGVFLGAQRMGYTLAEAMTMTFFSLIFIQFFKAYSFRSDHASTFHHPFANRWLNMAIMWELVLLALLMYIPVLQQAFDIAPLTWEALGGIALISSTVVLVLEITKWVLRMHVPSSAAK